MNERRRFLKVLGGSVLAIGAAPLAQGCGGDGGTPLFPDPSGTGGAGGAGGAGGMGGGGGEGAAGGGSCAVTGIPVGTPDKFATDGLHKVVGTKVLIGRDAGGLFARSSVCTHKLCNMNASAGSITTAGITCKCHGSKFDVVGAVTMGPATKPLPSLALVLGCDGILYADTLKTVDPAFRLEI